MGRLSYVVQHAVPIAVPQMAQAMPQASLVCAPAVQVASLLPAGVGAALAAGHGDGVSGSQRAWLEAAENFEMNTDFDVPSLRGLRVPLAQVIAIMKAESIGKRTIQALGDKIMLHRILENLGVPQLPANLVIEGPLVTLREVEQCVHTYLCGPGASDLVVKPSHLSNSTGVLMVRARLQPHEVFSTIQSIGDHIRQFMCEKAHPAESAALRTLKPGFIVQPKYDSCGFEKTLEIRLVTLWGKARVAVWWYGGRPEEGNERNTWIVRRPAHRDALDLGADDWEVVHRHHAHAFDPMFGKAIELFRQHVREMARTAEMLSTAVGAPFLRTDFFVGDSKWGVRLNEVAYGSCIDYLTRDSSGCLADDAPAIAEIIQEGMARCRRRVPPEQLLSRLGVRGNTYEELIITPQKAMPQMVVPQAAAGGGGGGGGGGLEPGATWSAGDAVEVWARSLQTWCQGKVEKTERGLVLVVFTLPDGKPAYKEVRAGSTGLRRLGQGAATPLAPALEAHDPARHLPPTEGHPGLSVCRLGDIVEVWSNTFRSWFVGAVTQVSSKSVTVRFAMPSGDEWEKSVDLGHWHLRAASASAAASAPKLQASDYINPPPLPRQGTQYVSAPQQVSSYVPPPKISSYVDAPQDSSYAALPQVSSYVPQPQISSYTPPAQVDSYVPPQPMPTVQFNSYEPPEQVLSYVPAPQVASVPPVQVSSYAAPVLTTQANHSYTPAVQDRLSEDEIGRLFSMNSLAFERRPSLVMNM